MGAFWVGFYILGQTCNDPDLMGLWQDISGPLALHFSKFRAEGFVVLRHTAQSIGQCIRHAEGFDAGDQRHKDFPDQSRLATT